MLRQVRPITTPDGRAAVRAPAQAACQVLEREISRAASAGAMRTDLKGLFESTYKAQIIEVMLDIIAAQPTEPGLFALRGREHIDGTETFGSPAGTESRPYQIDTEVFADTVLPVFQGVETLSEIVSMLRRFAGRTPA